MSRLSRLLLLLCGLSPLVACAAESSTPPSSAERVLYHGGLVRSCVEGQSPQEALLTQGERVLAVGTLKEVESKAGPRARRVNLQGHTLMCGFVDGHVHQEPLGRDEWFVNTPEYVSNPSHPQYPYGPSAQEVVQLFRERVATTPPGTPAIALVSVNFWASIGLQPRSVLDAVSAQHPLIAVSWGGHGKATNSKGLELGGFMDGQPDPYGGRLSRDADGRLTGFVQELAEVPIFQALSNRMTDAELEAASAKYLQAALKAGQVRALNIPFMVSEERWDRINAHHAVDFWRRACLLTSVDEDCHPFAGESHLKIFIDGSPDRCEALMDERSSYTNPATCPETDTTWVGFANLTPLQVDMALLRVMGGQARLVVHALGRGAPAQLLSRLDALGGPDSQWPQVTLHHGDFLTEHEVRWAARHGVVFAINPTHLVSVPPLSLARFTPEVAGHSEPLRDVYEQGGTVAFASDDFIAPTPMGVQLQLAVAHPFRPEQGISLVQAIDSYTRVAAQASGWDDLGTLEPGKRASFQVLSRDFYTTPVAELPTVTSILTVVDGKVAWDAKVLDVSATP